MTALDRVELESFLIVVTAPIWFAGVVVWAGWCWFCDWRAGR
jgi:hypothetical protein